MDTHTDGAAEESCAARPTPTAYRLDSMLDQFDEYADRLELARMTGRPMGPITGFAALDDAIGGCLQPGLHCLTGNTGAGKSAFALQVACMCGFPALYVSCEQSALEQFRRVIARTTQTPRSQLTNPKTALPAATLKALARKAAAAAPGLVLVDAVSVYADISWIRDQAALVQEAAGAETALVVIDSLHSWAAWINDTEYERLARAAGLLRQLATDTGCAVLHIAEQPKSANREHERNRAVGASAPAGNRVIEYGAETVLALLLRVNENREPVLDACGHCDVTLHTHKNRNGPTNRPINLKFDGELMEFTEAE